MNFDSFILVSFKKKKKSISFIEHLKTITCNRCINCVCWWNYSTTIDISFEEWDDDDEDDDDTNESSLIDTSFEEWRRWY